MTDGPKRLGRFLKKGTTVFNKISLVDFSFQDIKAPIGITLDNTKRTIIHVENHDKESLDKSLRPHDKLDLDLVSSEERQQIIMPRDFTADWERDRSMRKRKITRFDDDDFELELETVKKSTTGVSDENLSQRASNTPEENTVTTPNELKSESPNKGANTWQTMNEVGKAINELHSKELNRDYQIPTVPQHQEVRNDSGIFTQVSPDQEASALAQYQKQQLELARLKSEFDLELAAILESEKANAYRDGFRLGEEKAEEQTRSKSLDLLKNITHIIEELSQLKFLVLSNVQDNFYTICQAIGEALVKREFSIHPDTFAEVLRRALAETVQPNKVKILVHPEMYEKLMNISVPDLAEILQKDPQMPISGFRLESHLSVIDGNISEMIAKMLKQADLGIFDKNNGTQPNKEPHLEMSGQLLERKTA